MPAILPTSIDLEIVTPEEHLYGGLVEEVNVPSLDGVVGILPGHAPMLSELGIGVISFKTEGRETHLYCSYGFVEVLGSRVSVLAQVASRPDEIDTEEAETDRRKAHAELRSTRVGTDYEGASELLRRAEAKLDAVSR